MNTLFSGIALRKLGTVLAGGVALMLMSSFATADITNSKHNLSASGTLGSSFSGTGEICIFCHTPHGADTLAPAPLWNRSLGVPTGGYTRYSSLGTPSLDATETQVGSISLACLSCHDGTQAMNSVINTPGSGTAPNTFLTSGTWTGSNVNNGVAIVGGTAGSPGTMTTATGFPGLGTDLSNDHPISMQYGGGKKSGVFTGAYVTNDPDFAQPTGTATPSNKQVGYQLKNSKNIWWVEANTTPGLQKDDLPLYTRNDSTLTGGDQPLVECASCHDPHVTTNGTFLRQSNSTTASGLCLTCHIK